MHAAVIVGGTPRAALYMYGFLMAACFFGAIANLILLAGKSGRG
jgi:hypothetical protein